MNPRPGDVAIVTEAGLAVVCRRVGVLVHTGEWVEEGEGYWQPAHNWGALEEAACWLITRDGFDVTRRAAYTCPPVLAERALFGDAWRRMITS